MARPNRQSEPSVKDILLSEPYRFEFHQAVKLLEYLYPKSALFGETVKPSEEVVKVKSRVFLESMASDIYSIENALLDPPLPHTRPTLNVNFMGIAGIQGPLPYPYTEMIIQRLRQEDSSLKDFLDIFNHRLISILHRIRKQYLISLNTQTPEKTDIATGLLSFLGLGQKALRDRLAVPDRSLLDYAGLYWSRPHSAGGLEAIIKSYFKVPIRIEKCVGKWRPLPKEQQTFIGSKGQWQKLGKGATLGTRVWDQQGHFRLYLGPLTPDQLDFFLPFGKGFKRLQDLTRLYVGPLLDFTIIYTAINPPSTTLKDKSYLGWRSWLGTSLLTGDKVQVENG